LKFLEALAFRILNFIYSNSLLFAKLPFLIAPKTRLERKLKLLAVGKLNWARMFACDAELIVRWQISYFSNDTVRPVVR